MNDSAKGFDREPEGKRPALPRELLAQAFDAAPIGFLIVDAAGIIVATNAQLEQMFGCACGELLGRPVEMLLPEALRDGHVAQRRAYTDGAVLRAMGPGRVLCARRCDGREFPAEIGLTPLAGPDGPLVMASIVDVTERIALASAHRQLFERAADDAAQAALPPPSGEAAAAAERLRSAYLAGLSDDIRTPMNAIVDLSRLVLEDDLAPRARAYVDKVHQSALALMGMLDDVLDYAQLEAGQLRVDAIEFDLEEVLQRVYGLFQARIERKGIEFIFALAPEVPSRLVGDPLRLSQVLDNLVDNAAKFTASGAISVGVTLLERAPDVADAHCRLRFTVRDSGVGIPAERLARLFDPFARPADPGARRPGSSGLGLAICGALVARMGGHLSAESVPGRGSEFRFTVPFGLAETRSVPSLAPGSLVGLRALVVDDNAIAARVLSEELEALEIDVRTALDGPAALAELDLAAQHGRPFDFVFLDWKMPGMDGLETLRAIRERGARNAQADSAIVLMVTAFGRDAVMTAAGDVRPDAVLPKPVLRPLLLDALLHSRTGLRSAVLPAPSGLEALRLRARPLRGKRLLLVEDNPINQFVAADLLGRLDIEVTIAPDGVDAVEAVREGGATRFDAVLMDLRMPGMDGFEATVRIHALAAGARLPVIAMSAAVGPEDQAQCFDAGMVDHLAKPIDAEKLVDVLLRWVRSPPDRRSVRAATPDPDALARPADQAPVAAGGAAGGLDQLPGFDGAALLRRVNGNPGKAWALLAEFVRTESGAGDAIAALLARGDIAAAKARVHQLRGTAAVLGALDVARRCEQLDAALAEGTTGVAATRALRRALRESMRALQAHLPR